MTDTQNLPARADVSYEVALDPEPPGRAPVPVDPPPPAVTRLPVIPPALRSRESLRKEIDRHVRATGHRLAWHGVRSPRYIGEGGFWAIVGVFRLGGRWLRWWLFPVPVQAHQDAAMDGWRAWKSLHLQHRRTTRVRAWISGVVAVPSAAAAAAMWIWSPWWGWALAGAAALPVLARAGRPADRRIISPATVTPRFRRLSADVVIRAYTAAGLCSDKPGQQLEFGGPMARDGEGSRVTVDLPYGKGLGDAMGAREKIASGLDVQVSQVFLHRDPTSHRRHVLWVADRDPLAVPVGKTPLLAGRATNIWKPAPLGLDERGQIVTLLLMWQSMLVGAMPRQGKTFFARLLGLFAALDPYVKLDVFDAAGKPDWRKFALVADSCAFGLTPTRDGLPPQILLATLERIKADVQDRYHRLSAMPTSVCPEGKLTPEIARDPRYEMPVRVLILDEFQEYYDLGDVSKQIAELLRFIVKVAPAAGVIVVGATQKPSGIGGSGVLNTLFTATRDNFQARFALRTGSYTVSEAVLGQGTLSMGLDASTLLPQYKGVGILHGASDASPTVRTFLADAEDAEKILTAARALRERAGTLSGMALGEDMSQPARDVLGDVLAVFGEDSGLHWELLASRLARHAPERWADATAESVSAECRALGVPSRDVRYPRGRLGTVRKGCYRDDAGQAASRDTAGQGG